MNSEVAVQLYTVTNRDIITTVVHPLTHLRPESTICLPYCFCQKGGNWTARTKPRQTQEE